jgi:hypothetical protein
MRQAGRAFAARAAGGYHLSQDLSHPLSVLACVTRKLHRKSHEEHTKNEDGNGHLKPPNTVPNKEILCDLRFFVQFVIKNLVDAGA